MFSCFFPKDILGHVDVRSTEIEVEIDLEVR